MRQVIGVVLGAVGGGLVGYAQWVCPDGQCVLTGSWFGGAALGAFVGLVIADSLRRRPKQPPAEFPRPDDRP